MKMVYTKELNKCRKTTTDALTESISSFLSRHLAMTTSLCQNGRLSMTLLGTQLKNTIESNIAFGRKWHIALNISDR